jgi:Tfp pilus assembly protein PilN
VIAAVTRPGALGKAHALLLAKYFYDGFCMRYLAGGSRKLAGVVHLFDELVTAIPAGVYLTNITQTGRAVVMDGRAQSNARVSAFMRNIAASKWIGKPLLMLIEHKEKTGAGLSQFRLRFEQLDTSGVAQGAKS